MAKPHFVVEWKDSSGTVTNITDDVLTLPQFTDTGSGEVNSAVIMLSANRGKYITDGHPIQDFDTIEIASFDGQGSTPFTLVYEVKRRIPTQSKNGGTKLELHVLGLEWHSQVINFADSYNTFVSDAFTLAGRIQTNYNKNVGTKDPTMRGLDDSIINALPNWTANSYSFGVNEESSYNRLMEIIDKMASPANAGGVFDFFELQGVGDFNDNSFTFFIYSSGNKGAGVLITDTSSVNVGSTEAGLDTLKGTVINAWGDSQSGSLPVEFSQFQGGQLLYPLFPQWQSTANYPKDALVQYLGLLWQSLTTNNLNNTPGLLSSDWTPITKTDYYGNKYRYSPWTVEQVDKWIDCGSDLSGAIENGAAMGKGFFDGNLVINDGDMLRSWVDIVVTGDDAVPLYWRYPLNPNTPNRFYPGFRVLQIGTPTGIFGGSDINGVPFKNAIIEYQDDVSGWVVKYPAQTNMMCAVIGEGKVYVFNGTKLVANEWSSTLTPRAVSANWDLNALDCFHPYDSIINDDIMPVDSSFTSNQKSAIKVTYSWNSTGLIIGNTLELPSTWRTFDWYKAGFWLNIRFPFPPNIVRGDSSSRVGELYGDSSLIKGPSFIDSQNMTYTHDGSTGFSSPASIDLGPLSSLDFLIRIRATTKDIDGSDLLAGEANFKIRTIAYDRNDNVAIQDAVVSFNDLVTPMKLPLSGFSIYQARKPLSNVLNLLVPPVAVSPVNIFEWRHVKQIVICSAESYDSFGRFNPGAGRFGNAFALPFNIPPNIDSRHKLEVWVDAFRFTKPLLANYINPTDTRHIEGEFIQKEEVLAFQQLQGLAQEEYQRSTFPHQEYDLITTLKHDIGFGDFFYYYNPRIVQTQNPPDIPPGDPLGNSGANTIKLVNKRTEYSYTKPSNGEGGAIRRIIGVKRFGSA
jgi:hypothetical protein